MIIIIIKHFNVCVFLTRNTVNNKSLFKKPLLLITYLLKTLLSKLIWQKKKSIC